ncbi:hypothetical protein SEA_SPEEDDEMON_1560 [Gordonia phage SpeedDemon]|uniref:Uncharacterized protein n=1 Tax=Gordonia phage Bantam TaxID=1887641 RepID=A0A1B3AYM6_9CAUD|nr:hypothetical protein BIZ77_gp021 [Gordonia phage Bantam]AOE43847.1 hypothetical protein SEA_BANTAM_158 [Gordonia phage Bantam]QIG58819.1 hypothetical protein SEA_DATBOI_155 [Gordonia phage DatBoi]QNL30606.1 hypothetical protein SEA_SPEEDDEMON_1560 [Gordonia phage SpeedDemon]
MARRTREEARAETIRRRQARIAKYGDGQVLPVRIAQIRKAAV